MNSVFVILDCTVSDGTTYVDNTCLTLQSIPPYTTTYGSNITFRCKYRLLQQSVAGFNFCPVELCTPGGWTDGYISCARTECYHERLSKKYMGKRTCGLSGTSCQLWNQQSPHMHSHVSSDFPDLDIDLAMNYCRDPAGTRGEPWCYTTNQNITWEFCEIPQCAVIKGGQTASRDYSKTVKDLPNYLQVYQHMTRSNLNCAEKCNLNPLCDLYTFESSVNQCILYEFDMNGNNVLCSGKDKCYIRHS
ncbi:PLG [Mytilus coruscus]|uniref:PLG n=1 Tax=Mytilus coruscus TaxID=42192 RepID=A0A6J8CB59_MYTCO|nr:PLG [Mytilus coruscus]